MNRSFAKSLVIISALMFCVGGVPKAMSQDSNIVKQFPEDVRPLLSGVSDELAAALLKLRNSPPGVVRWRDGAGALSEAERKAYWTGWEKITGWRIQDTGPSVRAGEVQAQVASGNPQFDIFETGSGGAAYIFEKNNLLEPLDPALFRGVFAGLPKGYYHSDHWIGYTKIASVIMWNTSLLSEKNGPKTAADFFDAKKFPGKRCISGNLNLGTIEYSVLGAGVPPQQVYPVDFKRMLSFLDQHRKEIIFYRNLGEASQLILSGECSMGIVAHGRPAALALESEKYPVEVSWDTLVLSESRMAIIKGAPNRAAAQTALAYAFRPQSMCVLLQRLGYGVAYDESCLNDFAKKWAITPQRLNEATVMVNDKWYADNYELLINDFNAWMAK